MKLKSLFIFVLTLGFIFGVGNGANASHKSKVEKKEIGRKKKQKKLAAEKEEKKEKNKKRKEEKITKKKEEERRRTEVRKNRKNSRRGGNASNADEEADKITFEAPAPTHPAPAQVATTDTTDGINEVDDEDGETDDNIIGAPAPGINEVTIDGANEVDDNKIVFGAPHPTPAPAPDLGINEVTIDSANEVDGDILFGAPTTTYPTTTLAVTPGHDADDNTNNNPTGIPTGPLHLFLPLPAHGNNTRTDGGMPDSLNEFTPRGDESGKGE
ncbi:hypothetical protein FACS1894152_3320 [Bacilli bacterium]|nr:hypothetical protein FACS1894152_3320 [Bacilli bacterium]